MVQFVEDRKMHYLDTYYRERSNGRWEYWTYCDGLKVPVSANMAERDAARGIARIVNVK